MDISATNQDASEASPVSASAAASGSRDFIGFIVLGIIVLALPSVLLANGSASPLLRNLRVWLLPLLIILFYIIGRRQNRQARAESRQRFADNLYFLGFIFTMCSLIATFLPAAWAETLEINPRDIYAAFGTALMSTALGLILRVLVMQTAPSAEESALQVEEDLTSLTARLAGEARAIGDTLAAARAGLAAQNEATVKSVLDGIAPRLATLVSAFGQATQDATALLATQAEDTRRQADKLRKKVEAQTTDITEAARVLADARQQVNGALVGLAGPVADLSRQLGDAGVAASETASQLRGDVAGLTEALSRASTSGQQMATTLGNFETRSEAQQGRVDAAIGKLEQVVESGTGRIDNSITGAADRVAAAMAGLERRAAAASGDAQTFQVAIDDAMTAFAKAVDRFAAELDQVRAEAAPATTATEPRVNPWAPAAYAPPADQPPP